MRYNTFIYWAVYPSPFLIFRAFPPACADARRQGGTAHPQRKGAPKTGCITCGMKRYTALILAAALLLAALAGCSGGAEHGSAPDSEESSPSAAAEESVPASEDAASSDLGPSQFFSRPNTEQTVSVVSQNASDQSGSPSDPAEIKAAFGEYQAARDKTGELVQYEFSQNVLLLLSNDPEAEVDLEKTAVTAQGGVAAASPSDPAYEYSRISSYKDAHRSSIGSAELRCYGDGGKTVRLEAYTDPVNAANSYFSNQSSDFRPAVLSDWREDYFSYDVSQIRSVTRTESGGSLYFKFMLDPEKTQETVRVEFQSVDPEITVSAAQVSYFMVSAVIDANGYLVSEETSLICRVTENGVPNRYEFTDSMTLGGYERAVPISAPDWLGRTSLR